jgi:RNA polymerase sigma-70 factor (ECF subfamily)
MFGRAKLLLSFALSRLCSIVVNEGSKKMGTAVLPNEAELKNERFEAVALEHMGSLYRYALCMAQNENDAHDLVQDTYLRAYRFFDKFEEGTNCKAWLITILKNTFINNIRRDKRHPKMVYLSGMEERGMDLPSEDDPEDWIFGELFDDDVSAAIESLPAVYRTVVLLADVRGFSYKEISYIVGCPIGTVMSRLCRGRRLLRRRLRDYADQYGYGIDKASVS